jgi:hypothetical protein
MTTNLHDKMLAAIDAHFSASDGTEEEVAENLLLDVRDEINKQQSKAQPAPVQEPWKPSDTANRIGGLPQDFIEHKVENEGDWSEWVNPDSEQYFMKCCDCGLVHEMQFKVVKYSEGDECEFIDDADLQAVFRARRATPPAAQPAPVREPEQKPMHPELKKMYEDFFDKCFKETVDLALDTTPPAAQQEYERGVIDGRQMQAQSSVDKAVNAMSQRQWVGIEEKDMPTDPDPMYDHKYFIAGMVYADNVLMEKNK